MAKESLAQVLRTVKGQRLFNSRDKSITIEELLRLVREELYQEFLKVKGLEENTQTTGLLNTQFNLGDISTVLDKVLPTNE